MTPSERSTQWNKDNWALHRLYNIYNTTRARALKKGIPFTITLEWFKDKVISGRCEVTGRPFNHDKPTKKGKNNPFSPSIDRWDPSKGYIPENCKVVVWIHNRAKGDDDIYTLYTYCKDLVTSIEGDVDTGEKVVHDDVCDIPDCIKHGPVHRPVDRQDNTITTTLPVSKSTLDFIDYITTTTHIDKENVLDKLIDCLQSHLANEDIAKFLQM
jgi:hypothetical protein